MKTIEKKATVLSFGKQVTVYRHRERDTWIDSSDLLTEYKPNQLKF